MPRQLQVSTLKRKIGNNQSPSMGTDYKLWAADCKKISTDTDDKDNGWTKPGSAPDTIKKIADKMTIEGISQQLPPGADTDSCATSVLHTIGAQEILGYYDPHAGSGEVDGVPPLNVNRRMTTSFSLLEADTDLTIIPNADILDIDPGYNRQLPGLGTISTVDKFPNYEQDPFYTPDDQFSNFKRAEKQGPFAGVQRLSNTALVAGLISLQNRLPTGAMLPAFTRAFDLER